MAYSKENAMVAQMVACSASAMESLMVAVLESQLVPWKVQMKVLTMDDWWDDP